MSRRSERLLPDDPARFGRPFVDPATEAEPQDGAGEIDAAREEAIRQGYDEGLARAQRELSVDVETFRKELQASLERIAEYEKAFAEQHQEQLLELTFQAASRIARGCIDRGDEVGLRAFREALGTLPSGTRVRARLHPDDAASVRDSEMDLDSERIEIVEDESLSRGGAILESDHGRIDATLETAEDAAREAVLGKRE